MGERVANDWIEAGDPHAALGGNVDAAEIAKFSAQAAQWWEVNGAFKTLHQLNPLRLHWILQQYAAHGRIRGEVAGDLLGQAVLDVGCGGGILSESLARAGAQVTGIDLASASLAVAREHAQADVTQGRLALDYRCVSAEDLARQQPSQFALVTCMEMLEHVPDPVQIVQACAQLVRPGGVVVMSTINRHPKAFLQMIVAAEYMLGMVPLGTHYFNHFITPAELCRMGERAGLVVRALQGIRYAPLFGAFELCAKVDVNYMVAFERPLI
ncbi:MAG: bifunctional 2-polyprenyl-6-hydroxyphenol methylase/3-demethylubiquinol 3-O-methyltransferase UbiG [Aeromonas sp.]